MRIAGEVSSPVLVPVFLPGSSRSRIGSKHPTSAVLSEGAAARPAACLRGCHMRTALPAAWPRLSSKVPPNNLLLPPSSQPKPPSAAAALSTKQTLFFCQPFESATPPNHHGSWKPARSRPGEEPEEAGRGRKSTRFPRQEHGHPEAALSPSSLPPSGRTIPHHPGEGQVCYPPGLARVWRPRSSHCADSLTQTSPVPQKTKNTKTGSEMQRDKEAVAALMREKQRKGMVPPEPPPSPHQPKQAPCVLHRLC